MEQPDVVQCWHGTPCGFAIPATPMTLQHKVQEPQRRPGTIDAGTVASIPDDNSAGVGRRRPYSSCPSGGRAGFPALIVIVGVAIRPGPEIEIATACNRGIVVLRSSTISVNTVDATVREFEIRRRARLSSVGPIHQPRHRDYRDDQQRTLPNMLMAHWLVSSWPREASSRSAKPNISSRA